MFCRLGKFDGPIFGWHIYGGAYIPDVNWVTYFGDLYTGRVLTGLCGS